MRVKKLLRIGVVLVVVAVILVLTAVVGVRLYLTPERLGQIAQSVAGQHLDTEVQIGSIKLKLFRSIEVSDIEIAQPDGFEGTTLASLDKVVARFRLLPLLNRRLEITELTFETLHISISRSADGQLNAVAALRKQPATDEAGEPTEPEPEAPAGKKTTFAAEIRALNVRGAEVQYIDETTGMDVAIGSMEASLHGNLSAEGTVAVAGEVGLNNLSVQKHEDVFVKDFSAESSFDISMDQTSNSVKLNTVRVAALDTAVDVTGILNNLGPETDFDLELASEIDAEKLTRRITATVPAVSLPINAAGEVELDVEVTGTAQNPKVSISVDCPEMRIEKRGRATGSQPATAARPKVNTRPEQIGPFDLSFVEVQLSARCGRVEYSPYEIAPLEISAALKDNKFVLDKASLGIAQGTIDAKSTVDLGVAGLAYAGTVAAQGVDAGTLLEYCSPKLSGMLSGKFAADVEVAGQGTDIDRAETSVSGGLDIEFTDGRIDWPALVDELGPIMGLPDLEFIPIVTVQASVTAGNGEVRLAPLTVVGPDMSLDTEGSITTELALDLETTLSLSRELTARISNNTDFQTYATREGQLVIPLTVKGTLGRPKLRPNLKGVAEQAKEKVRDVVEDKLNEELDKVAPELGEIVSGFFKRSEK